MKIEGDDHARQPAGRAAADKGLPRPHAGAGQQHGRSALRTGSAGSSGSSASDTAARPRADALVLSVGYSNPVEFPLPEGISGDGEQGRCHRADRASTSELLGDVAASIRKVRKPDSYKGKGIRYDGEVVRIKPGKSAVKGLRLNCKE
ncbi:MAG: 50S ribosomal protein L6 [Desulfomicrobium escambiense]|nr:50S ribosomal protein L6 [Desulfomicrobium escambiense]